MAMNNSANLVKYPGSLHPNKPSFPHDPLLSADKLDFSHITKHDPKFPMEAFNDIFAGNMPTNPSMNPLMDRNNPNPDFFLNQGANPNMTLDSGLLYGFPNVNQPAQGNPNPAMTDPSAMYQQNRNMMFPGGMQNQPLYEDLMKSSNPADYLYLNQLGFNDKNLLGSNMLGENMGFLDRNNQFLFQGLEQELAQSGQMPFQNQLFLNNLMGAPDFNLQNFFMPGFGFEDLYNLQMQGGMPNPNMPGAFGGMPGQNVPGAMPGMPGAGGFPQGNTPNMQQANSGQNAGAGGRQMPKVEMNPAARQMGGQPNDWANMNPQAMQGLQGMNQANFGGFPSLKVEGQAQQLQKAQANMKQQQQVMGQPSASPHMGVNAGNPAAQKNMAGANMPRPPQNVKTQSQAPMNKAQDINSTVNMGMNQPIKPLMASKSEPPQSQQAKPNMYGMNPAKPQESNTPLSQAMKSQEDSNAQKAMNMWAENLMMTTPELNKMAQSGPAAMMKANSAMNPADFGDLFGKGLFDPLMMGKTMKDNQVNPMDPFGLNSDLFLGPQMDVYNKLKEKNKYERSLKIERYKNKKRNWQKKIAYECRRRVANTRLRIKGRFISKKDCEKIYEFVGEQGEAFNDKKNLNLDYITSKLNVYGEEEDNNSAIHKKFNISKNHILNKIDDIINNKKHSLTTTNVANFNIMKEKVGRLLRESKKIFKLEKRPSSGRGMKAMREEDSADSNSLSSPERKQNVKQDQMEQGYGMEGAYDYQEQMQAGNEPGETPMGFNDSYMAMNQQAFERMIAQDERFANIPKDVLEAMMMNMMQMNQMGMHQGMDMAHMGNGR